MTPTRIGAALLSHEIADHRSWLFDAERDIELQDFRSPHDLRNWKDTAERVRGYLDGHKGRLGIHGPFEGLDIDNKASEIQPIITERFLNAVAACEAIGARQMVVHSPFSAWYQNNLLSRRNYAEDKLARIHKVLGPVVARAENAGVTLVIENIEDVDPYTRLQMAQSFNSPAIRISVDTGHAHLARCMSGAPPADFFLRAAEDWLAHVHVQDLDGHADRHWAPGDGAIEWRAVFAAITDCSSDPHVVLELRNKADIPRGFAWLAERGLVQ